MKNVVLKNTSTSWISETMDSNTALLILYSQTMDQAKNWYICEDQGGVWMPILKSETVLQALMKNQSELKNVEIAEPVSKVTIVELPPEKEELPFVELTVTKSFEESSLVGPPIHSMPVLEEQAVIVAPLPVSAPVEIPQAKKSFKDVLMEEPVAGVVAPQGAERRAHPRYDVKLRVIIKSEKNTFLTFTKDVSLGGLNLMNEVPDYIFVGEVDIYITAPDGRNMVMFKCSPVPSKLGKSRLRFTRVVEEKHKVFESWINTFIKPLVQKIS